MNTENTQDASAESGGSRPLGFWLRTVDALISREFAQAFDGAGVTRRDWMLLNAVSGDVEAPGFTERFARKGGKRLRSLEDRGWVEETGDGTWILTDEGRVAKERLGAIVDGIRSRVSGAVSPEDFATTLASLEAIARELGWDETTGVPWSGFGRGFGRGFRPRFGPGPFGNDFRPNLHKGFPPGFGPGGGPTGAPGGPDAFGGHFAEHSAHHDAHHGHEGDCHGGRHHGHGRSAHGRHGEGHEKAYERGFDAGFQRGRDAS